MKKHWVVLSIVLSILATLAALGCVWHIHRKKYSEYYETPDRTYTTLE